MRTRERICLMAAAAMAVAAVVPARAAQRQVDEAEAVFDGTAVRAMRGGTWKVVYSSAEGPEGSALKVLTDRLGPVLLRDRPTSTALVLPLEKAGVESVANKRDRIILGVPRENARLRDYVKVGDVPPGGYLIRTFNEKGRNTVLLAGDGPSEVLWATFDFLDVVAPTLERQMTSQASRYEGALFRAVAAAADARGVKARQIPTFALCTAPETQVRSIFSWGHVVDDCRATFRVLARARFNRAILWNDQRVVNAREVVDEAHAWGVKVYWGFSWGWTLSGSDEESVDFEKLADGIVAEWRAKWRPMGGDGIYFQSFTETNKKTIGGTSIPEAVVALVNTVAARIRAEAPETDIVFGLHANSMKYPGAAAAIAKTDPRLEILWENCGGFPFWESDGKESQPDQAFCDKILALTPSVGLAWKAQLRMDWSDYAAPAGPYLLGCAGPRLLARDRAVIAPTFASYDEDWIINGRRVWEFVRCIRAGAHPPKEFNAVAEYNPPYAFATLVQAELFWNSSDSWADISRRARLRGRAER